MTFIERAIARIGIAGLLALLLAGSVGLNLWQLRNAAKAEAACEARIAALSTAAVTKAAERDTTAIAIADDATEEAAEAVETITVETIRYVDRIRRVPVEVPANCPRALPDGVRDALADAAAAANRPL